MIVIEILQVVLMILGAGMLVIIIGCLMELLSCKFKQIMKRQNKIRCLCKHEYLLEWNGYYGRDLNECVYQCRKCGSLLRIKVVEEKECE